jgi:hypothetical protein
MDRNRDKYDSEASRKDQPQSPGQGYRKGQQSGRDNSSQQQPRDEQGQFVPEEGDSQRGEGSPERTNPIGAQEDLDESETESDLDETSDARERAQDSRSGLSGAQGGNVDQNH